MEFILDILGNLGFDWRSALFTLINFLVIFFLLRKLFFDKVTTTIRERQAKIDDSIDKFEKAEEYLIQAKKDAQEVIEKSKIEANAIIKKAHDEAVESAENLRKQGEEDVKAMIVKAEKQIEFDRDKMKEEIKQETVELVVQAVEKIIEQKLDTSIDQKLIESSLNKIK